MEGRRVIHDEYGTGMITLRTYIGPKPVFYVKFNGLEDEIILDRDDSRLKFQGENKSVRGMDYTNINSELANDLEKIHEGALKEAEEVKRMDSEALIEEFERLIRDGAGLGYRRLVFVKKEILRRIIE